MTAAATEEETEAEEAGNFPTFSRTAASDAAVSFCRRSRNSNIKYSLYYPTV